jgi:sugar fermentation stimulation protein A
MDHHQERGFTSMSMEGYQGIKIPTDTVAVFRSRPNRFLGIVDLPMTDGSFQEVYVHIHDPGRLTELLFPGNRVLLRRAAKDSHRKTSWDLIAAAYDTEWILIHSAYHRHISDWIFSVPEVNPFEPLSVVQAEVKIGHSRLDYILTRTDATQIAVEIKGCSLTLDHTALFPDAPTARGKRHLELLRDIQENHSMDAALIILVFRPDSKRFAPNDNTDPEFASTFWSCIESGVQVYPMVFQYDGDFVRYTGTIPVRTNRGADQR